MKKLIQFIGVIALIAFSSNTHASHIVGGDIQYEYVGPGAGSTEIYKVRMRKYRDSRAAFIGAYGPTVTIDISSSCAPSFTAVLNQVNGPGRPTTPNLDQCVSTSSPQYFIIEEVIYEGNVIIPTACNDWIFAHGENARNAAINTINAPGSQNFYIEALLNNLQAPGNSSPNFVSTPVRVFCLNSPLSIAQTTTELNGDSLRYTLVTPKTGPTTTVTFLAPYTATFPLSSSSPFIINARNGLINFTPDMIQVGAMAVLVEEFRYDSVNNAWIQIGSALRDMQINIASQCKSLAAAGPQLSLTDPTVTIDPITGHPLKQYDCRDLDSTVVLKFSTDIICASVDPTGADMRLTHPNGTPVPVLSLNPQNCNFDGTTKELQLKLHVPLSANGDYILYTKVGFDGNTLTNACGFGVPENDTIILRVSGCFTPQQKIENVLIEEDNHPKVQYTPDLASFPGALLDEYRFYRAENNIAGPYSRIGGKGPANTMNFDDFSLFPANVDQTQYFYYMSMVINGFEDVNTITDTIGSILLTGIVDFLDDNIINLRWTPYNGWGPGVIPNYSVFTSSDSGAVWTVVPAANGIAATNYTLTRPTNAGDFWISVRTTNPNNPSFTSISNWIGDNIPEPPSADPVVIPNVISPNSKDPANTVFTIENIEQYVERNLVVHNRWGKKVYESSNYTNEEAWDGRFQGSGDVVGDGVYFYELILTDSATNETKVYKGSVHVFTNE